MKYTADHAVEANSITAGIYDTGLTVVLTYTKSLRREKEIMSDEKKTSEFQEHSNGEEGLTPEEGRPQYTYYQPHQTRQEQKEQKNSEPKKKHSRIGRKFGTAVALAAVFGLVAGTTFQAVNIFGSHMNKSSVQVSKTEILPDNDQNTLTAVTAESSSDNVSDTGYTPVTTSAGNTNYTVADVAAVGMPSVVAITSVSIQEIPSYFSQYFGYSGDTQQYPSTGSGSGIIVGENDEELLIATNKHVVSGANTISVCFMGSDVVSAEEETTKLASGNGDLDLENAVTGKLKGEDNVHDLAVVAVNKSDIPEETLSQIRIAELGNSENLVVGEQVVAIGNALGFGQSVTSGYVSALNRSITTSDGTTNDSLIQTDAAINPGNSGGALLNMRGQVIGINSAKYADSAVEGMGYAIPMSTAQPILEELMNRKTRDKVEDEDKAAYMGVSVLDLTTEMIQMYDLPQGAYVKEVTDGGPAQTAGIQKGDIITKVDGQSVAGKNELVNLLTYYEAGEVIPTVIYRSDNGEYKEQTIDITLGKRADSELANTSQTPQNDGSFSQDNTQDYSEDSEAVPSIDEFFEYFR